VYYSAVILYLGACFTRAYAHERGSGIYPNKYAVWVENVEVHSKESLDQHQESVSNKS
jgi:membrane protein